MSQKIKLPTLYKKNQRGSIRQWDISVSPVEGSNDYEILTEWGEIGGAIQRTSDLIREGKNIGKKNETSVAQQAEFEAHSSWTYKQDREGYVNDISKVDEDQRIGIDPMLAQRYDKYPEKMSFPCFIQPKLDGHRCIAIISEGECTLYSRTRNVISGVPHINKFLVEKFGLLVGTTILDGELYNHDYKNKFEELTGFIRSETPKEGHEVVQYHIYDVVWDCDFETRFLILTDINASVQAEHPIRIVETVKITHYDISKYFKQFRDQGYEGAILRDPSVKYEHKRSYGLQKVKEFEDSEFKVVSINEGRGKMKGHAIFECVLEDGTTKFEAKLKGEHERLKEIFQNSQNYIGRLLTVQFQGRTKNNIPRFPVGLRIREEA